MSDVYILAIDDFFPCLRSLRICVGKAAIKTALIEPSTMRKLRMSKLENFDLYLNERRAADEGEEQVKWVAVETLLSSRVMPRLRRFSFIYKLSTSAEIRNIFESSIFDNDSRHICVRFALNTDASDVKNSSEITHIFNAHSSRNNELLVESVSFVFPSSLTANSYVCDSYFRFLTMGQGLTTLGLLHHG